MPEAYAVASGKGGTGKTSVTAGVACALARMGYRCLCIDADVGIRSLDIALGVTDRALFDFYDVYRGRVGLSDAAVPHPVHDNLRILAAPLTVPPDEVPADALDGVVRSCADADFIFLDCPAGLGPAFRAAAAAARHGIVVATPDPACLRSADRTAEALLRLGAADVQMVLNRLRPRMVRRRVMPGVDESMEIAGLPLLGCVPEDEAVIASQLSGAVPSAGKAGRAYAEIAGRLARELRSASPEGPPDSPASTGPSAH